MRRSSDRERVVAVERSAERGGMAKNLAGDWSHAPSRPRRARPYRSGKLANRVVSSFRIVRRDAMLSRSRGAKLEFEMKSSKQRRQEIKVRRLQRAERKACRINARPVDRPVGTAVVTPALLRPTTSYGIPEFVQRGYYQDRPFRCKDCGMEEVWTAVQQRWWYEVARGDVWTIAMRCRACRQRERARKTEARRVHLAGLAARRERSR